MAEQFNSKATNANGTLNIIEECYIKIPEFKDANSPNGILIPMNILPDISDRKSAQYSDEAGIGRSMPFKNFQSSENRSVSWTIHWLATSYKDHVQILKWMRALEACTYPRDLTIGGAPYAPPPICKLKCGNLLSNKWGASELSAVLKEYSVKFDTTVPWDQWFGLPQKLDLDLTFDIVYNLNELPGAEKILYSGY